MKRTKVKNKSAKRYTASGEKINNIKEAGAIFHGKFTPLLIFLFYLSVPPICLVPFPYLSAETKPFIVIFTGSTWLPFTNLKNCDKLLLKGM